jgi:hypothetical protein
LVIADSSVIVAMNRSVPPHLGHSRAPTSNTRRRRVAVHVRTSGRDAPTIGSLGFGSRGRRRTRKRGGHVRGLGHRRRLRLARACLPVLGVLGFGHNVLTPSRCARQHAHVPNQRMTRWGHQTGETHKKLHRVQMGLAPPWVLHLVRDSPACREAEARRNPRLLDWGCSCVGHSLAAHLAHVAV